MHNTVFILASLVILIALFYILTYCLKMYRSEIIEIRDITVVVIDKDRRRDTRNVYRHGEYETIYKTEYKVKVECINNSNKWTYLDGRNYYKKYDVGDTLTMQEIFFKDKDSFFSEIRFATSKNYKELEKFKTNNPNFSEEYTMEEVESYVEEYHEDRTNSTNLLNMILFPILLVIFIFGFISISKIFKEYGSTVTLKSSINIGGGNVISEIGKIEIEGTNK